MSCNCAPSTNVAYAPARYAAPINPGCLPIHLRGLRTSCKRCSNVPRACVGMNACACGCGCGSCGCGYKTKSCGIGGYCYGGDSCGGQQYPNYPADCHPPQNPYRSGTRTIEKATIICGGRATILHFACGGCEVTPNAYIPSNYNLRENGTPMLGCRWGTNPAPESEGMDCPNYIFNHVNPASP